jgi:hypothetical protein
LAKFLIKDFSQGYLSPFCSPILWLRDVAAYLNLKLVVEDSPEATAAADESDCLGDMPLAALSQNMRKLIFSMLQNCTPTLRETLIETCIANTAHELAKGLTSVVGWRMLTQALAELDPHLVVGGLPRFVELRNSYQNRPAIGLAILWSVGQAGRKDVGCGVRVWLEMMLPVLQMRHYTRFVVDYLGRLLALHNVTETSVPAKPVMDISNFCTVQVRGNLHYTSYSSPIPKMFFSSSPEIRIDLLLSPGLQYSTSISYRLLLIFFRTGIH